MIKKVVVVGGGTAGWLAALMVKNAHPYMEVTVVASNEIGILGAGEGTTPTFVRVLQSLNIPVSKIITECKGTIKLGIDFINWGSENKKYFHSFFTLGNLSPQHNDVVGYEVKNGNIDNLLLPAKAARAKKIPVRLSDNFINHVDKDSYNYFDWLSNYALHFDANLLAAFLQKVAQSRGIVHINDKVVDIKTDQFEHISYLTLEHNGDLAVDFVFDCSGFSRLIIGNFYKSKWVSYKEKLPVDTAVPFFIDHDNDVAPSTEAIAMQYGWMWKIPVRGRYGCGYVFDSTYISEVEALQEVEKFLGHSVHSPRTFKFEAGVYEKVLINNCLAVGLAQGFIEPLEATSIWQTTTILEKFINSGGLLTLSKSHENALNNQAKVFAETVLEFLQLHYYTDRNDTEFWRKLNADAKTKEKIDLRMQQVEINNGEGASLVYFNDFSWGQVASGLGLYSPKVENYAQAEKDIKIATAKHRILLNNAISHKDFISIIESNERG